MLVGLSLSFCIQDIINGRVDLRNVSHLVCGTRCETRAQFDNVLHSYARSYWREKPTLATLLAIDLWNRGLLVQPRVSTPFGAPVLSRGVWLTACERCGDKKFYVGPYCHTCGSLYGIDRSGN